jgi:hypothetical protein
MTLWQPALASPSLLVELVSVSKRFVRLAPTLQVPMALQTELSPCCAYSTTPLVLWTKEVARGMEVSQCKSLYFVNHSWTHYSTLNNHFRYTEPWHSDIFDFLDLRKNSGKEELRARDLFLGLWIPDLFMKSKFARSRTTFLYSWANLVRYRSKGWCGMVLVLSKRGSQIVWNIWQGVWRTVRKVWTPG